MRKLIVILLLPVMAGILSACANTGQTELPDITPPIPPLVVATPIPTPALIPEYTPMPVSSPTPAPVSTPILKQMTEAVALAADKYAVIIGFYREYALSDLANEDCDIITEKLANELNIESYDEQRYLSYSNNEYRHGNMAYAIHDVNNDGLYELIIFSEYPEYYNEEKGMDYDIHTVYSLKNNNPILLGAYWSRNRCEIDENGAIYNESSSGAADSTAATYIIDAETLSFSMLEMVGMESFDEETLEDLPEARCYYIKDGEKTIIDIEEAVVRFRTYYDYSPPSPTTYAAYYEYFYIREPT